MAVLAMSWSIAEWLKKIKQKKKSPKPNQHPNQTQPKPYLSTLHVEVSRVKTPGLSTEAVKCPAVQLQHFLAPLLLAHLEKNVLLDWRQQRVQAFVQVTWKERLSKYGRWLEDSGAFLFQTLRPKLRRLVLGCLDHQPKLTYAAMSKIPYCLVALRYLQ